MRSPLWIALIVAAPALALPPYASEPAPVLAVPQEDPFTWEIAAPILLQGGEGRLELRLVVPDGHVAYRDQLDVQVVDAGPLRAGATDFPPAMVKDDPVTGRQREQYVDDVVVWVPLKAPKTYEGGVTLVVQTRHQGCRPGVCFPATTIDHTVLVPVRATTPAG